MSDNWERYKMAGTDSSDSKQILESDDCESDNSADGCVLVVEETLPYDEDEPKNEPKNDLTNETSELDVLNKKSDEMPGEANVNSEPDEPVNPNLSESLLCSSSQGSQGILNDSIDSSLEFTDSSMFTSTQYPSKLETSSDLTTDNTPQPKLRMCLRTVSVTKPCQK